MKSTIRIFCTAILALSFSSCGGGGGGGGGSGVRFIHASIDSPPASLATSVEGKTGSEVAKFGTSARRVSFDQGAQTLSAVRGATGRVLASTSIDFDPGSKTSLLFFGDRAALGLHAALLNDEPGEVPSGQVAVRVVHAVNGAGVINFTLGAGGAGTSGSASYGQGSEWLFIAPGVYRLAAVRAADQRAVFSGQKSFTAGSTYTVVLMGEVDYLVTAPDFAD
ncbi:MAG: DUF4397 domain-containing protein [Oligoflexia bacterium]|nr:DUF4397 domain-containing protein [Oligoflexia bacterium]